MDEVKTNRVENLPVLDKVPEGATLIAEVDGVFYRVNGEGVGGGGSDDILVIRANLVLPEDADLESNLEAAGTFDKPWLEVKKAVEENKPCLLQASVYKADGKLYIIKTMYFEDVAIDSGSGEIKEVRFTTTYQNSVFEGENLVLHFTSCGCTLYAPFSNPMYPDGISDFADFWTETTRILAMNE